MGIKRLSGARTDLVKVTAPKPINVVPEEHHDPDSPIFLNFFEGFHESIEPVIGLARVVDVFPARIGFGTQESAVLRNAYFLGGGAARSDRR